ncbi:MAG: formate--tetrahydrofolate ligase [Christensenellaceae bacterium]|jgi:formate--tetrahydrofolate ligase
MTDIEIASAANVLPIAEIARSLGIGEADLIPYGKNKAKISLDALKKETHTQGRLVLVTAINPTPAGEGKTTVSIGLADALKKQGESVCLALREPSLGPVFGMKGGATGGGYSQVVPMEDINLHFTGDMHAITAANNLLCALIDNHIFHGNKLAIDPKTVSFCRCLDINDRELRHVVLGLGKRAEGYLREDSFHITAASEIMAVLCMATDIFDLERRLGNMLIGFDKDGGPVYVRQLGTAGALTVLLKEAVMPNLVQTLEHTPVLVHGGPFANIAHGCNSILATKMAMHFADYTVTEAGFGADLGAEKFLDIKCRNADIWPNAVVIVVTVRALKYHGGAEKGSLKEENPTALAAGFANLDRHIRNLREVYDLPVVVAINRFAYDTDAEIGLLEQHLSSNHIPFALSTSWANGGEGALALADAVKHILNPHSLPAHPYDYAMPLMSKIRALCKKIYGAGDVEFSNQARVKLHQYDEFGFNNLPVCIAKTQYSFSDDARKTGAPEGFTIRVRDASLLSGAGFIVIMCGDIMRMPGLPAEPAALSIYVDETGQTRGLF